MIEGRIVRVSGDNVPGEKGNSDGVRGKHRKTLYNRYNDQADSLYKKREEEDRVLV